MVERHPFEPFLPEGARVLFLGSFPPQPKRWCMEFYYPNFINDFWRICGLYFFGDKEHFVVPGQKRFDKEAVVAFCRENGFALYDTASAVRRLADNASDKFLEVVTETDVEALLARMPQCRTLVTTGQKATEVLVARFGCSQPSLGGNTVLRVPMPGQGVGEVRELTFWRMPSTSRAYPLSLEKKTEAYAKVFEHYEVK